MMIGRGLILSLILTATALAAEPSPDDFFEQQIRPVLLTRCLRCHGPDKASSGLRVDGRDQLLKGGDSGAAIVPGQPNESILLTVLKGTDPDRSRMPPDKPLANSMVADFEHWIRDGAHWPETPATRRAFDAHRHWAFVPVSDAIPPEFDQPWSDHPVDRFVEAKWRERGVTPVGEADARTLIRRLWFDLVGLPPHPDHVTRFEREYVDKQKDEAFAREIDRLLASPHYGERWGRHWMDVVRYADTAGDNADYPIPEAVQYRDYIINAFNNDKPFDQFVQEQIAGDLMPEPNSPGKSAERIQATGFLALSRRYATGPYELWHLTLEDTIDTVGKAVLGLTLKCARCHDHKFDPVTANDYYALYGIFDSTQFPWAGAEEFASQNRPRMHFVPLQPIEQARESLNQHQTAMKQLELRIAELEKSLATLPEAEQRAIKGEIETAKLQHRKGNRKGYSDDTEAAYGVTDGKPHDVAVQIAGEPVQPGVVVPRGAIAFLSSQPLSIPAEASGRLQLAQWLTSRDNPLTARVIANRIWQHHFGRGIVATPSNFGTSGSVPTHPELLDYLATRLIGHGWSMKALHRLILTSKTWRLSSAVNDQAAAIDTGNEYMWRHHRRRLDAEAIRDAFLSVAGKLDLQRPGLHPFPSIEHWGWTQHNQFKEQYPSNHRSVYLMTQRLQRHPFLSLFDSPDTNTTTDVRTSATVPTQALFLLNSPEMAAIGGGFADRLRAERPTDRERIAWAYEIAYSRPAMDHDLARGEQYLATVRSRFSGMDHADDLSWQSYCRVLLVSNAFFYVD